MPLQLDLMHVHVAVGRQAKLEAELVVTHLRESEDEKMLYIC